MPRRRHTPLPPGVSLGSAAYLLGYVWRYPDMRLVGAAEVSLPRIDPSKRVLLAPALPAPLPIAGERKLIAEFRHAVRRELTDERVLHLASQFGFLHAPRAENVNFALHRWESVDYWRTTLLAFARHDQVARRLKVVRDRYGVTEPELEREKRELADMLPWSSDLRSARHLEENVPFINLDAPESGPIEQLVAPDDPEATAEFYLSRRINDVLVAETAAFVFFSPLDGRTSSTPSQIRIRPRSLLGALYLQLGEDVFGYGSMARCANPTCDVMYFHQVQSNQRYCSYRCRNKAYRDKNRTPPAF